VELVELVELEQTDKTQLLCHRPTAVRHQLVQLNKQVDLIGGVQDGL
jgi:hypothetical protein